MPGEGATTAVMAWFGPASSNEKTERTWGKATGSLGDRLGRHSKLDYLEFGLVCLRFAPEQHDAAQSQ